MNKLNVVKSATGWIVGAGVGTIVATIIKNNVEPEKKTEKVTVFLGTTVSVMMAKDIARQYTDAKIDEAAAFYYKLTGKSPAE